MADDLQPGDDLLKMFRSSSASRKSRRGYVRLDPAHVPADNDAKGAEAVAKTAVLASPAAARASPGPSLKKSASTSASRTKSHPLFSFFDPSSRKKPKMKPELVRYLEYIKEGGTWDPTTNRPVIYFK
ncbi:hypothetical protein H6P81_009658 [Aristolochia fimbriata]|uniref:Uncharacterized protein n=1 Tax=Aristolochia fimbriata TaxID=158543 RepID=A0AAV7ELI5_ARIFI|nr:hypothetical protein H6P81_009658 [Aristolochia fimbriata]